MQQEEEKEDNSRGILSTVQICNHLFLLEKQEGDNSHQEKN